MLLDVRKHFDEFITKNFAEKEEMKNFLLNHERKEVCLQNLCREILIAEDRGFKTRMNRQKYQDMIEGVARMFCQAALEHKVNHLKSDLEKSRMTREVDTSEMDSLLKEVDVDSGEVKEIE